MKLKHGIHLAYCTNIHRGETWAQTFATLNDYALKVKERMAPNEPYAIGLRLGDQASRELSTGSNLADFKSWLAKHQCYVFTINGFPYGSFHGTRVKEQVYAPDWTTQERVDYTNRLFDILAELVPDGVEGSVSTVPCSFKEFIQTPQQVEAMVQNVWKVADHIAAVSQRTGKKLHLGLEPEPLCYLETSEETVEFFKRLRAARPHDTRLREFVGVSYDACHLGVEFEKAADVVERFAANDIRISKLHFSNALKVRPNETTLPILRKFLDTVYFHQVVERLADGTLRRYKDLDVALEVAEKNPGKIGEEWRIHFHVPLHSTLAAPLDTTADHLTELMNCLGKNPGLCSHIEMETYTWEVLPPEMKNRNVVDQLCSEYEWTLAHLKTRGLA